MEYNWEEFEEGQPYGTANRIQVTLNAEGKLFFNRRAIEALGEPDGVALMYDRRRSVIGVKPSTLERQGSYKLRRKDTALRSGGRMISAKNFCRRFAIRPTETLAFTTANIRDDILILDLNNVRSVKKKR